MNDRNLRWPGFHKIKLRQVQDRLCFGLAVEAQRRNEFQLVE